MRTRFPRQRSRRSNASVPGTPVRSDALSNDMPSSDAPSNDMPSNDMPSNDATSNDALSNDAPPNDMHSRDGYQKPERLSELQLIDGEHTVQMKPVDLVAAMHGPSATNCD